MTIYDQIEHAKLQERLAQERNKATPRYERAARFASQIAGLLHDFLPADRTCRRSLEEFLVETAFARDVEIAEVPANRDELAKITLAQSRISVKA